MATNQIVPLPWVRSPKATDAVIAPDAPITYPEEKRDYGGRLIFESCSKEHQEYIIECVTLRPGFDLLVTAVKESCDSFCSGVMCKDEEYADGASCEPCGLMMRQVCCRKCAIHLALESIANAQAELKSRSTEIVVREKEPGGEASCRPT